MESRSDQLAAQSHEPPKGSRPSLGSHDREAMCPKKQDRQEYQDRDKIYALRPSEIHTLTEVGKFRVVAMENLARFAYAGDRGRMESDLRNLKEHRLVELRSTSAFKKESRQVLALANKESG